MSLNRPVSEDNDMLFQNFDSIKNPAATTQALIAYAITRKMDEDEITRQANAANPRVWAPEACQAMGVKGNSSGAIFDTFGNPMVELCQVASGITALLIAQLGSVDFRRIQERVNSVVVAVAV